MEKIKLNLVPGRVMPVCHASQLDVGRTTRFDLYDGENVFTLSGAETITASLRKPSNDLATLSIVNTSSNYVDMVTDTDTLNEAGFYLGELTITENDVVISSANFVLKAEMDPYGEVRTVTVSGSVVQFTTDLTDNLLSAICSFLASQASGTPTPSAPIPIVGVDKVNVTSNGTTALINLGDTYYGGEVDAVTGKITLTHTGIKLNDAQLGWNSANSCYAVNKGVINAKTGTALLKCSCYKLANTSSNNLAVWQTNTGVRIRDDNYVNNLPGLLAAVGDQILFYELETPVITYASNTADIPTIVGDNQVFCDTGDITVTYMTLEA